MKPKLLSISAYNLFSECPAKYDLEKNQGIKPVRQPSYFIFGSAVDKGCNALLEGKGLDAAQEEAYKELDRVLTESVFFLENDYDRDLLNEDAREFGLDKCRGIGYPGSDIDSLVSGLFQKSTDSLTDKQSQCLAILCHISLVEKAKLMLIAYEKHVLPKLTEVKDVQKKIFWRDELGNEFTGVLDFTAKYNGHPVTADNKTSAPRVYNENSVKTSLQFAAYTGQTKINAAVYFVMNKAIQKNRVKTCSVCGADGTGKRHKTCDSEASGSRCEGAWNETIQPEALIEIYVDEVSPEEQKITQSALTDFAEANKKKCYPKNLKSCIQRFGSRESKCPYYDYCRNGSMKGLVKK